MQHDHVLKKLKFDLFDIIPRVRGSRVGVEVKGRGYLGKIFDTILLNS